MALTEDEEFELLSLERERAMSASAISPKSVQPSGGKQLLSDFVVHPLIEGGAMAAGGLAGAALGAPAGPVGAAASGLALGAAMYPPARRAAESVDRMLGLTPPPPEPITKELATGVGIEAGGRALQAAAPIVKPIFRAGAKKMANLGQTISGAKAGDLMAAYDQGLATYAAPSLKKAGKLFDAAAIKAGAKTEATIEQIIDPDLGQARDIARELANKIRAGGKLTAQEALSGRQAIDFIKEATPFWHRKKLFGLRNLRDEFQDVISTLTPELEKASKIYRQAKIKSTLLKPMRINKRQDYSALLPVIGTVGSAVSGNPKAAAATIGAILGTSPLAVGLGATLSGQAAKTITRILKNPVATRAIVSGALTKEKAREYLRKADGNKEKARQMAKKDGWNF